MWPEVIALKRKAKNDLGLKAYFWRLGPSWKALDQIDEKLDHLLLRIYNTLRFQYFQGYDRLYQRICEFLQYFQL